MSARTGRDDEVAEAIGRLALGELTVDELVEESGLSREELAKIVDTDALLDLFDGDERVTVTRNDDAVTIESENHRVKLETESSEHPFFDAPGFEAENPDEDIDGVLYGANE